MGTMEEKDKCDLCSLDASVLWPIKTPVLASGACAGVRQELPRPLWGPARDTCFNWVFLCTS